MPVYPGSGGVSGGGTGGTGGAGGTLGSPDNIFGDVSGDASSVPLLVNPAADRTTAETTRDNYFIANPGNLTEYDNNSTLGIYIYFIDGVDVITVFQTRLDNSWVDSSSSIGFQGTPGDDAPSQWFLSETDRNDFYDSNLSLLETGLVVAVNNGDGTYSVFEWTGATSPGSQDTELWVGTGETFPAGSIVLGTDGSTISSGGQVMNYITAEDNENYILGVRVETTGTEIPFYWDLGSVQNNVISSINDTNLSSPATITFTVTNNRYTSNYIVIPYQSGDVRVETYIGTDDTGSNLTNFIHTFVGGDIGNPTTITLPNKYLTTNGTDLFIRFTGAGLRGELATSEPVLSITEQVGFLREYVIQNGALIDIDSPSPTGEARLQFNDESGDSKLSIFYDEAGDFVDFDFDQISADFQSNIPDTSPLLTFLQTGTNGATVPFHFGDRSPEGNVTADRGSIYFSATGVDDTSAIYIKETGIGNTGWTAKGTLNGPATSVNNSLVSWDGTTGTLVASEANTTITDNGTTNELFLRSPSASGSARYALSNSSGSLQFEMEYNEVTDAVEFLTIPDMSFGQGPAAGTIEFIGNDTEYLFETGGTDNSFTIDMTASPDTNPIMQLITGGTDGGTVEVHVGDQNPNTVVTGNPGALYLRDDGTDSTVYVHADSTSSVNNWINLIAAGAGDVSGPASATDTAIARFDGATGKLIQDSSQVTLFQDAINATIQFLSPAVNGAVGFGFNNSLSVTRFSFTYAQLLDQNLMTDQSSLGLLYLMNQSGAEYFIQATNNDDTDNVLRLSTGGTNDGTVRFYVGDRNPLNNVTANPGSVYFRQDGVDSDIYLHRGASSNNTGWVDLLETQGNVVGPGSSSTNYICVFDNTDGNLIAQRGNSYITESATSTLMHLGSVTSSGSANLLFEDEIGTFQGAVGYNNSSNILSLSSTNDLIIATSSAAGVISVEGSSLPDTLAILTLDVGGANGAVVPIHAGDRNPDGTVSAVGGNLYFRADGTDSNIYVKKSATVTTADWYSVISTSPSTVTDRAIAFFDGTTGDIISDDSLLLVSTGAETQLTFRSPGATDGCEITFLNSSGVTRSRFFYNENVDETVIDGLGSAGLTLLSADTIDVAGTSFPDTLALFEWVTTGSNGATVNLHVGSRNPEGNVNADPGAVYFRADGVDSDIYVHRAASSGTTGWVDLFESGVQTDLSTSVDGAIAIWDGTDAGKITQDPLLVSVSTASSTALEFISPSVTGFAGITYENSASTTVFNLLYSESADTLSIQDVGFGGLIISSNGPIEINPLNGDLLTINSNISFASTLDETSITMSVPSANETTQVRLTDVAGATVHGHLQYHDALGQVRLEALQSSTELHLRSDQPPVFIDVDLTDANPILTLSNTQNGFQIFSRVNDPNGSVAGTNGDIVSAGNGLVNTAIYLAKGVSANTSWAKVDMVQKFFEDVSSTSTLQRNANRIFAIPLADITIDLPNPGASSQGQGFEQEIIKNINNTSVITIDSPGFYGFGGNFVISKYGDAVRYIQDSSNNIITYTNRQVVGIMERTGAAEQSIAGLTGANIILNGWNDDDTNYYGLVEPDQTNDRFIFPDVENTSSGDLYEIDCVLVYRHSNNSVVVWHATVDDSGIATNYTLAAETQSTSTSNEKTVNLKGRIRTGNNFGGGLDTSIQLYFTLTTGNTLWFKRGWWKLTKIEGE